MPTCWILLWVKAAEADCSQDCCCERLLWEQTATAGADCLGSILLLREMTVEGALLLPSQVLW